MSAPRTWDITAAQLREAFDRSFADPEPPPPPAPEPILCIRIGGDPWAIRRGNIRRLVVDRRIVLLPSTSPSMLGVLGLRGELVPVHSLRALLGYQPGPPSRWVMLAASDVPMGLAFDAFEGHLRLRAEELESPAAPPRPHVRAVIAADGMPRGVLDLGSILEVVKQGARR